MATVVYLPQDPNMQVLGQGLSGAGQGLAGFIGSRIKKRKEEKQSKEYSEFLDSVEAAGSLEEARKVKPPQWMMGSPDGVKRYFDTLETVYGDQTKDAESFFSREGQYLGEGKKTSRPRTEKGDVGLTIDEFKALRGNQGTPSETDKNITAELRKMGLPNTSDNRARMRSYLTSSDDIYRRVLQVVGKEDATGKFTIDTPAQRQRLFKGLQEIKKRMLNPKQPLGVDQAISQTFDELGWESPQQEFPPPPAAERRGAFEMLQQLLAPSEDEAQPSAGQVETGTPAAQAGEQPPAQEELDLLGVHNGREVWIPKTITTREEAWKYLISQNWDVEEARRFINESQAQ